MTAFGLVVTSDRAADQAILEGTVNNTDGDNNHLGSLPVGFGDCLFLELVGFVTANLTITTDAALASSGAVAFLQNPGNRDFLGVARLYRTAADRVAFHMKPDQIVMWKADESLNVQFPEIDINVAPTGDFNIFCRVRRLRQTRLPREGQLPIRIPTFDV